MKMNKTTLRAIYVALSLIAAPALFAGESGAHIEFDLVLPLALLGIGIFLLFMEVAVLPGFGFAGVIGIILVAAGLFIGVRDFTANSMEVSTSNLTAISVGVVGSVAGCLALCLLMFKILPILPGARRVILRHSLGHSETAKETAQAHLIGQTGVASTDLRPTGKINIGGHIFDVTTTDGYVTKDEQVYVEKIHEGHMVVRKLA